MLVISLPIRLLFIRIRLINTTYHRLLAQITSRLRLLSTQRKLLAATFLLLTAGLCFAQPFKSIGADFVKISGSEGEVEEISGKIYYQVPDSVLVFVSQPLRQWLKYGASDFTIFYPDSGKVFQFANEGPNAIPLISTFISLFVEDFGLSQTGFTIGKTQVRGDTLDVNWIPPPEAKEIGLVQITFCGDKLLQTNSFDADNKLLVKNSYGDHLNHKGYQIPMRVESLAWDGTQYQSELLLYSNPVFDPDFQALSQPFYKIENERAEAP